MLARLDEIDGVERTQSNHAGTLVRVSLNAGTETGQVAKSVLQVLAEEKRAPIRLAGADLRQALTEEQWRDVTRIGELSKIEFRTLVGRRVKAFVESEELSTTVADRLVKLAGQTFDEFAENSADLRNPATVPVRWKDARVKFSEALAKPAKQLLADDQVERLRDTINAPHLEQRQSKSNPTEVEDSQEN